MKRSISILLALCILASLLSVSGYALTNDEIIKNYDFALNVAQKDASGNITGYISDGKVNLEDARAVLRVSAGIEKPRAGLNYDVTGDGLVDVRDVKGMLSIVLGIDINGTTITDNEYLLTLFKNELNSIKSVRPGFTKTATAQCHSMKVTTRNAPVAELNVTNTDFDVYTNKTCDYMEGIINNPLYGALLDKEQKAEMKTQIAELRKQAAGIYDIKTSTKTVERYGSHYYHFPVNNLGNSCFLELSDIQSITSVDKDGYIIRTVTMKEDTYVGDEFPTGNEGFTQRWKTISYGKVFNIPDFDETEGAKQTSILNKVTFKDGKIVSKIDKLTGLPVQVDYTYTYIADISTIPEVDKDGKEGLQMDSVTTATNTESFVINPVTVH